MSKLLAPNGKPSNLTTEQYKLVRSSAFKKWFGDWENDPANASKVVDYNGEPLVVYHGGDIDFNVFDLNKTTNKRFHFTTDIEYAKFRGSISKSYFLKINNLTYEDWNDRRTLPKPKGKFVGFGNLLNDIKNLKEVIVFDSNQIKLADGTNTTFDGSNPDIRFDEGGSVLLASNGNIQKELYHYTSETNFDRIFDSNILNTSQKYGHRLSFTSDSEYHKKQHGLDYGNTNVRITFDNEKLISDGYSFSPFDHSLKQNKIGKEFEYVISIPIKNVKKYIKNITIFKGNAIVGQIDETATNYANKYYLNSDIRFKDGGEVNTGLFSQIWEWFGIKF